MLDCLVEIFLPCAPTTLYRSHDVEGITNDHFIVRLFLDCVLISNNEVVLALWQRCHVDQAKVFTLLADRHFFL